MKGGAGAASGFLLSLAVVALVLLLPARWLAVPLLGVAVFLFLSRRPLFRADLLAPAAMAGLAALVWFSESQRVAMLYPVIVNGALLGYFYGSLRRGPTAIERLARLEDPQLPSEGVGYTRVLTKVWCGFFVFNGAVAALTAWWGEPRAWALYNGLFAYVLIGALVVGERLLRPRLLDAYRRRAGVDLDALIVGRDPAAVVCLRGKVSVSAARFRAEVAAKSAAVAAAPAALWIVSTEDAYVFAVDLLAVCLAGKQALVPQNHQAATLEALRTRYPAASSASVVAPAAVDPGRWRALPGGLISFHTSGSTGEPKCVTRSFAALLQEAAALESLFGAELGDSRVIGTVPHHFIYGAIFRILWPLQARRVFQTEPLVDGYAVLELLRAGGDHALVSSPSLMERLPADDVAGLRGLRAVFTSGSFLRPEVAVRWGGPIEVYGSTETSGIAWRRQRLGGEGWRPLPGVTVALAEEGRLRVVSPYVAEGGELTGDAARLRGDGTFDLLGRVDRIAKVEGRRVSLPELEGLLEAHPAVERCALVQPDGSSRLAGAVVLKPGLAEADYPAVVAELRARLVDRHDAVVAPRRWRFLPALPVDARGKLDQRRLRAIFDPAARPLSPEACWPQLIAHRRDESGLVLRLHIPADLPYFEGHFPGLPILPGVALLSWVKVFDAWFLGGARDYVAIENLKFTAAVHPGETLELTIARTTDGAVRFRYESAREAKAGGAFLPAAPSHVL